MNDHNHKSYPPPDYGPGPDSGGPGSAMSGPPRSQTNITLSTNPAPGATVTQINLDIGYFKTLPGILKIVQLIIGIICMACASPARGLRKITNGSVAVFIVADDAQSYGAGHNHWFLFVVVTSFIITLLWTFCYFLQIRESMRGTTLPCSWLCLEYYYTIVATILYFIAFIVILAGFSHCLPSSWCGSRVAAGIFGIFNTIAYGLGAYILHNDFKATPRELQ